jgi:hypothetical protein
MRSVAKKGKHSFTSFVKGVAQLHRSTLSCFDAMCKKSLASFAGGVINPAKLDVRGGHIAHLRARCSGRRFHRAHARAL